MRSTLFVLAIVCAVASPGLADWKPGDPHKMHYPQLPDPNGWDVNVTRVPGQMPARVVADDWQCSQSGPVTDIHLWGSWKNDIKGMIDWIDIAIYTDDPVGPGGTDPANIFSKPDREVWFQSFHPGEFTERFWTDGTQGWYDPFYSQWNRPDHFGIWQYNITGINVPGAFEQQLGQIYWLAVSVRLNPDSTVGAQFGWKTSLDHFNDDAVWANLPPAGVVPWEELIDPITGASLDMAFVITPEPVSAFLLVLGAAAMLRRRR